MTKIYTLPKASRKRLIERRAQLENNVLEGQDRICLARNELNAAEYYTAQQKKELEKMLDTYEF